MIRVVLFGMRFALDLSADEQDEELIHEREPMGFSADPDEDEVPGYGR